MTAYLIKSEIDQYAEAIKEEFELLLKRPRVVKSTAKQWDFFRHCFDTLMGDGHRDVNYDKKQAIGFKHEVSLRLREYYSKPHTRPIRFKFALEDKGNKNSLLGDDADYICAGDYLLLIIPADPSLNTRQQVQEFLCRIIDDAIHAEFDAYSKLAEKSTFLEQHFLPDGQAYNMIRARIEEHRYCHEIISNPGNPSTRPQLRNFRLASREERLVKANVTEYWNLYWLSTKYKVYTRTYQGQNSHSYMLVKPGDRWLIQEKQSKTRRGRWVDALF